MKRYAVAALNVLLLALYGLFPGRFSWYALLFPLIFTVTYYLLGSGTKLARNTVLLGVLGLAAYLSYTTWEGGYNFSFLLIVVYAVLRLLKLDGKVSQDPQLGSRYLLVELGVYLLGGLAGFIIGFDNNYMIVIAGALILIARELTEKEIVGYLQNRRKTA